MGGLLLAIVEHGQYEEARSGGNALNEIVFIAIGVAVITALLVVGLWFNRLVVRALFKLVDCLPPFRPGGRYRSQSLPEEYASLRRPRIDW